MSEEKDKDFADTVLKLVSAAAGLEFVTVVGGGMAGGGGGGVFDRQSTSILSSIPIQQL